MSQVPDTNMTEMRDVMVDLETTGTSPDAAILSIGAVAFDRASGALGPAFYQTIDLASAVQASGIIEPGTFMWWLKQSEAARNAIESGKHINVVLIEFSEWLHLECAPKENVRIWGNGADFDPVVLARSYERSHLPRPWNFWNSRCFRTLRDEHPTVEFERAGTHHHALDDAISQARHLLKISQLASRTPPTEPGREP